MKELERILSMVEQVPNVAEMLAGLFRHLPAIMQIYAADGRSLFVNDAFRRFYGTEPGPDYNVLEDELADRAGALPNIRRAFAGETIHIPPTWHDPSQRASSGGAGRRRAFQSTMFPLKNADGRVTHVVVVAEDVEDKLRLERERRANAEAQRVAAIGSWERDLATLTEEWSDELFHLLGVDPSLKPSQRLRLSGLAADERQKLEALEEQLASGGEPYDLEVRLTRTNDGEPRTMVVHGAFQPTSEHAPARLTGTVQDITERRRLEANLQIAERLASVGTLAAGVAHEINNPLGYILMNLDVAAEHLQALAGDEGTLSEAAYEALTAIADAMTGTARIRTIVHEMRTFSRAADETRGAVDINAVLDSCIEMARNEVRHRARLVRDYASVPDIHGNEARVAQVFLNLIINAAQAIDAGRANENELLVRTRSTDDGRVCVEVKDTGCGIPPENLSRIFDPFFTTKAVGSGTGIGLSVCHGVITHMGGVIEVDSEPGRGSTFRVLLPVAELVAAQPSSPVALKPARRARILVVDDDVLLGLAVRRALVGLHEVEVLSDGRTAVELLCGPEGASFELVLCDLMMPDFSGVDVHEAVAARAPQVAARMVFMTGGAFTPAARAFVARVPNRTLEKPMGARELREAVREWLARA